MKKKLISLLLSMTVMSLVSCKSNDDTENYKLQQEITLQSMQTNYNVDEYKDIIDLIINNNKAYEMTEDELKSYEELAEYSILENCKDRTYNVVENTINDIYYFNSCIMVQTVDTNSDYYLYKIYVNSDKKIENCIVYEIV